jgi:hypothetical protein
MLEFIEENFDSLNIDFITWTGDNSAHNIWDKTQEETIQISKTITDLIKNGIKNYPKIAVYPAIGNHDLFPSTL